MDIPILTQSRLRTEGITQPVTAARVIAAITPESQSSGTPMKRDANSGIKHPLRGEEQVDISALAKLLSKGAR